ncbi:MAG: MFS transporter [Bacteroidetes bacterium]|nr:MFS transporter [Bacteroidota bacterium]
MGAILFPIISLGIILAIPTKNVMLIKGLMAVYSISFLLLHITPLPFIMKHCSAENRTSALALQFQVWGIAVMTVGVITFILQRIDRQLFNDKNILLIFCMIGFIAVYYIQKIKVEKIHDEIVYTSHNFFKDYDWKLIWKATISVQLIAVGAGFTIPFISLFFQQVFDFNTEQFSILTSLSHFIVAFAMFITPWIKNRFGYKKGIIGVQSLAVVCLVLFATTEWYKHLAIAPIIAMVMYVIRQPLMNSAGPLTSELSLEYVGAKNREMISSIDACIWNSGWLFSAIIFEYLRKKNMPYSNIFLITAALYTLGIMANAWIIADLEKRKKVV